MKICIVCDVLGQENNGTTIAAMNLIRYLKSKNHEVRVLCCDQDKKDEEGYYVVDNINFGKLLNKLVKKVGVSIAKNDKKVVENALNGVDHIHILLPFLLGTEAVKYAKEHNISTTASFHMQAENLTSYFKLNKFNVFNNAVYRFIYKHLYSKVDAIHYPTSFIRGVFESSVKNITNGYVISNGANPLMDKGKLEKPEELKDKILVLNSGRYAREKSQDTLIKAIKYSKYKDKIQLILAGQGLKEKYYKRLSKKLPVKPIFAFYSREEMANVFAYSDIYVHSAEVELEGISCLEAISLGKFTIISDSKLSACGKFALDNCLYKNRNPKDLARVLDYWIENESLRLSYEKKYKKSVKVYKVNECMEQMEKMITEVVNRKKII